MVTSTLCRCSLPLAQELKSADCNREHRAAGRQQGQPGSCNKGFCLTSGCALPYQSLLCHSYPVHTIQTCSWRKTHQCCNRGLVLLAAVSCELIQEGSSLCKRGKKGNRSGRLTEIYGCSSSLDSFFKYPKHQSDSITAGSTLQYKVLWGDCCINNIELNSYG